MATLAPKQTALSWFMNRELLGPALVDSFRRMTPRYQWRNPVMFVVYIGSIITTILWIQSLFGHGEAPSGFILAVTLWLWATLVFANFAEAIAEGRSKAQAASLKSARKDTVAKKLAKPERDAAMIQVPSSRLRKGDIVVSIAGFCLANHPLVPRRRMDKSATRCARICSSWRQRAWSCEETAC